MSDLEIFLAILSMFIFVNLNDYFYSKLTNNKFKINIIKEIFYGLLTIVLFFSEYKSFPFCTLITSIFMYIFPVLFYKTNPYDTIYNCLIVCSFCYFMDLIINLITINITPENLLKYQYTINCYFIIFCSYVIIKTINLNKIKNYLKLFLYDNIQVVFFAVYGTINYYILSTIDKNIAVNNDIRIKIIVLFIFNTFTIMGFLKIYSKFKRQNEYCKNISSCINEINKEHQKIRIEQHNINNYLISLKALSKSEIINSINKYIKTNNNKGNKSNYVLIPSNISGFIINKINIYSKINFKILGSSAFEQLNISDIKKYNSLCQAIGIAIDNAAEAVNDCTRKVIVIEFVEDGQNYYINVYNEFNNKINSDKLGKLFYTTKKYGTGIGLFSITKIKSLKYKINIYNNIFKMGIIINKKQL
jgi:hypothetical protein